MSTKVKIPDNALRAIGRVTTEMAALELSLGFVVDQLLGGHSNAGLAITSELGFRQLIAVLGSLYKAVIPDEPLQSRLLGILQRAERLESQRNKTIHSHWSFDQSTQTTTRMKFTAKYRKGVQLDLQEVDPESIDKLADDIAEAANDLSDLLDETIAWIGKQPPNKRVFAGG